ncbi:MAG: hypothetical protein ABJG78_00800 [Cyclobacteriaceae bacterium]
MIRIIVYLTCIILAIGAFGQKSDSILDYIPTENLDMKKDANSKANRTKKKRYNVIYRPHAKNILYGNPCAVEATHKMGFEYMVESRNATRSASQLGKFWNNLRVKSKLVVTRTPFWKMILKKKFKKCRPKSGDIVG